MKVLKQFEDFKLYDELFKNRKYWLVPTDNRLKIALRKICDDEFFISRFDFIDISTPYIFVCQYEVKPDGLNYKYKWEWNKYHGGEEKDEHFKDTIYMGRVDVSDAEFDANKYNL